MLNKLLAAVGLAGTLMLSLAAPAQAHGFGDAGFRRGPGYVSPSIVGSSFARASLSGTGLTGNESVSGDGSSGSASTAPTGTATEHRHRSLCKPKPLGGSQPE